MASKDEDLSFTVTPPTGDAELFLLREMTVNESISGMFRMRASLLSKEAAISFEDMLGGAIAVKVKLPDTGDTTERYFHGIISRFSQGPAQDGYRSYEAEIVPWLWLLTRGSDCRIFQEKTIPEIISQVFDDLGFTDYKLNTTGTYPKKEYCVQYRETHFNFVSRLMEEAGIAYFFEHGEKEHTLVLFDDSSANASTEFASTATYASAVDEDRASGEVEDWQMEQVIPTGACAITDYNFQDPQADLKATETSKIALGGNDRLELFDYPGEYGTADDGQVKARLRMEAEEADSYLIQARSSRADFTSGYTFDLVGHFRDEFNQTYLLTSVTHHLAGGFGRGGAATSYANTFHCIPASVPFRPIQRTAKPIISGAQTATVVGASGEEIDVDEFGRVVLQFHWDRVGTRDEKSSCRVRVSQSWAGKGWGAMFHPRIGHEVIVEFLEGDPDRPIVVGRVYNGEQVVPYDLPGQKTMSGVKSRSSKEAAAENYNGIQMEDKKGSEMFSVQAEKDYERVVKNNESDSVEANRSRNVGKDETIQIGAKRKLEIGDEHTESVGGSESLSVAGGRTRSVGEAETISIGEKQSIEIGADHTLTIGGSQTIEIADDMSESIGGKAQASVAKEYMLSAKKIQLVADDEVSIKVGKAQLIMKKNGDITLKGKKINVKGSGDVIIKGSKIAQN